MEYGAGQHEQVPEGVHEPDALFAVKQDTSGVKHPAEDEKNDAGQGHPLHQRHNGRDDAPYNRSSKFS